MYIHGLMATISTIVVLKTTNADLKVALEEVKGKALMSIQEFMEIHCVQFMH